MKINYDVSQGIIDDCCNESFGLLDGGETGEFHVKKNNGVFVVPKASLNGLKGKSSMIVTTIGAKLV